MWKTPILLPNDDFNLLTCENSLVSMGISHILSFAKQLDNDVLAEKKRLL